ncbi:MAG: methyltransferase domain-containing protein [Spirochaetia bacterium]|nr:methyltransferase domain-containing protein [Spirochaetia bacterium]
MLNPLASPAPWSLVASGYKKSTQQFLEAYSRKVIELLKPGRADSVLDVATGPGTLAIPLSGLVREIRAIDFSDRMIEELHASIEQMNIQNILPSVMDGQELKFDENQFDMAFSMFGLMFFPDKIKGMREIHRVLKPGKFVAISSWGPISASPMMQLMFGAIRAAIPETPPAVPNPTSLENPDYFKEQLTLAGFVEIEVIPFAPPFTIKDVTEFFDTMVEGSAPIQLMRSKMTPEVWKEKSQIMFNYIRDQLKTLPVSVSSQANLAIARKPA